MHYKNVDFIPSSLEIYSLVYQDNQLLGLSGCTTEEMADYFFGSHHDLLHQQTEIDYLESCGLMLHRRFLLLPGLPFNRQAMMVWVQANAQIKSNAKLSVDTFSAGSKSAK